MAQIWVRNADGWSEVPLEDRIVGLTGDSARPILAGEGNDAGEAYARLVRRHGDGVESWRLVAGRQAGVRVNGQPLFLGIRVLKDRDALQINGGDRQFFSTERPARVEPFDAAGGPAKCPRCKQRIDQGCPVVRCPGCGVAHHQSPPPRVAAKRGEDGEQQLPCWTGYDDRPFATCANCDHPATLIAELRWDPEDL